MITFIKGPDIKACYEEEAKCIINQLSVGVGVIPKYCNLSTIFDATEKHFRGIGCGIQGLQKVTLLISKVAGVGWSYVCDS